MSTKAMRRTKGKAEASSELKPLPSFTRDAEGKLTMVTLDTAAYVTLLVQANITDPALWPPGMQEGASALARIRQIEADCVSQYAAFDWGKLPKATQDEYDAFCAFLDRLQDTGERLPLDVYIAQRKDTVA